MKGKKVYLRILTQDDLALTVTWLNDDEISSIMGYLPIFNIENQKKWYEKMMNTKESFVFAICLKDTKKHIGNVGLGKIDYINRNAMLNIFIANERMRGKGYGSEAIKLILDFAFNRLNLHKVYLQTSSKFTAAVKMYQNLGFINEGLHREHYYSNGSYEDKLLFSILKHEFKRK